MSEFIKTVEKRRKALGWTKALLAKKVGMSPQSLNDYIGPTPKVSPGYELICVFAVALDIEPGSMFPPLIQLKATRVQDSDETK